MRRRGERVERTGVEHERERERCVEQRLHERFGALRRREPAADDGRVQFECGELERHVVRVFELEQQRFGRGQRHEVFEAIGARARNVHEAGAGALRGARDEQRRAGHPTASAHDADAPCLALVRVLRQLRRDERTLLLARRHERTTSSRPTSSPAQFFTGPARHSESASDSARERWPVRSSTSSTSAFIAR